ncbi:MAG: hypothetical protein Q8908_13115 [Bacteroidota bacterium]|nr:hypothetical protein [Bacteroidota bacterium]
MKFKGALITVFGLALITCFSGFLKPIWQSKFVQATNDKLTYVPDENGNIIPDFSRVGYHQGDKEIPDVPVVKTISANRNGESQTVIQKAIDEVSALPLNSQGIRGTILLKKGIYNVPGILNISKSGIVLRGEGDDKNGTVIIATGKGQRNLLNISGPGRREEIAGTRTRIADSYVPVGTFSFKVENAQKFKVGDPIVIFRPGTDAWIRDIKMDQITVRPKSSGTIQWTAKAYDLQYERTITKIEGNKIYVDNPVVMAMETRYGGGSIYKYSFTGRVEEVGVENILFKSDYESETDEDHGWEAVDFGNAENCWARNITAQYFGYSCVFVGGGGKYITITDSKCTEAKSQITGGRRYSFNINGQMVLVKNCQSEDARHDYVTGARVCGPNVFFNCKARRTHADIGPHHRWATGTLFDNIDTDGEINVQDRQYMGSGHGWAGANQVLWNCKANDVCVQDPWASAKNYCIGTQATKKPGSFPGRLDGEWEGQNKAGLDPSSLYLAQLKARKQ